MAGDATPTGRDDPGLVRRRPRALLHARATTCASSARAARPRAATCSNAAGRRSRPHLDAAPTPARARDLDAGPGYSWGLGMLLAAPRPGRLDGPLQHPLLGRPRPRARRRDLHPDAAVRRPARPRPREDASARSTRASARAPRAGLAGLVLDRLRLARAAAGTPPAAPGRSARPPTSTCARTRSPSGRGPRAAGPPAPAPRPPPAPLAEAVGAARR